MAAFLWNPVPAPVFTAQAQFAAGAKAYFYVAGTTTPLTTFQDAAFTSPHAFPVVANALGIFAPVFVPYGSFRVRVVDADGVAISDADQIDNPEPPDSGGGGGGGGIVVTQEQILQTGDVVWRLRTGIMSGFIRLNGLTIGSSTSGATERANADCAALFSFLWSNLSDAVAVVSGGRGASAAADFAANKTIIAPSMRGRVLYGLDDMGATEAGIIQAITTCTTNNTTTVVVVLTDDIVVGMNVKIAGVANGTVVSISGTSIVLSQVASGSASGVQFRASKAIDAIAAGQTITNRTVTQLTAQMPVHTHGVTQSNHTHTYNAPSGANAFAAGAVFGANAISSDSTSGNTASITINDAGSGQPMVTLPSGRLGTYYCKL